jgi:uncharacterized protein (DUF169 family)
MTPTSRLQELLALTTPPVAVSFVATPPPGVRRIAAPEPASCGYWKRAAAGEVFYTDAADHQGCPVGAHTHGVPMSPEKHAELQQMVGTMVQLEYLAMDEVPRIPHRTDPFAAAVYAPLGAQPLPADVVLVRGRPRQLMLLAEAAQRAGVAGASPAMGRPTCAVLPQALASERTAASFGCIGNRVYTGAGDDEAWFAVPGGALGALEESLDVIVRANHELEKFHRARASS